MTQFEIVLYIVHATLGVNLGDMQQAISSREDIDKGTERSDIHHSTWVDFANFCLWWVRNQLNTSLSQSQLLAISRTDSNDAMGTVFFDFDGGASLFFDLTNRLAFWTNDLTDLVLRNPNGNDTRGVRVEL